MSETGHTERLEAALAGRYKIERKLGEGGMASVYLAEDLKHKRKVALKILRPELAAVLGADRFLAEIQTTANLQHPHILALFDSGSADGYLYYVMPYIEGETLREKLDREKQLGVDEAVGIARDVADALDYAHRHDVIHRDIKPANILLHDGRPVVADFGIALAVSAAGGGRMTETGLSLGTPHYMSPEQASADRDLSARSDVYSLGCVLYEMLAGQPPHTGPSAQSILVHILTEDPRPLTDLRHTVPPNIAATVAKAIEKLPADRFESARDFREALGDGSFTYQSVPRTAAARPAGPVAAPLAGRDWRAPAGLGVAVVMTVVAAFGWLRPESPRGLTDVARFAIPLPDSLAINTPGNLWDLAISPDGGLVVYQNQGPDGSYRLILRSLDQLGATSLRGSENAVGPFVSADGQWVAFHDNSGNVLREVSVFGGPPVEIVRLPNQDAGADWLPDGRIIVGTRSTGLLTIPTGGGEPQALTELGEGEQSHSAPHVIRGRDAVVFVITPAAGNVVDDGQLAALDLGSGEITRLGLAGFSPRFVSSGHLVYAVGDGSLRAVRFDAHALTVIGTPVPLVEGVEMKSSGSVNYDISDNGTLVYLAGSSAPGTSGLRLAVVDLAGNERVLPLAPRQMAGRGPAWSPDGRSVVFASDGNVYTYDVELNTTPRQITFEGQNVFPVFSPDGARLAFSSVRSDTNGGDIFVKDLNDDAPPRPLLTLDGNQQVRGWPTDSLIVFESSGTTGPRDLWLLDLSDPEAPEARPYLTSEWDLADIAVSPDGTLAAYSSDETGRREVFLRSFPTAGQQTRVSDGGGTVPFWAPDGNTLFIGTAGNVPILAARLRREPVPTVLSLDTLSFLPSALQPMPNTTLHPDGDRFITAVAETAAAGGVSGAGPQQLIIVLNFLEELRQRLGDN